MVQRPWTPLCLDSRRLSTLQVTRALAPAAGGIGADTHLHLLQQGGDVGDKGRRLSRHTKGLALLAGLVAARHDARAAGDVAWSHLHAHRHALQHDQRRSCAVKWIDEQD